MNRMAMRPHHRIPLSILIYRALLTLYPADYRREYGHHMLQVFGDCLRDASVRDGASGVFQLWASTLVDLVNTVIEERSRQRIQLDGRLFVRLSGLAAMAGGALWIHVVMTMASRPAGVAGGIHRKTEDLMSELLIAMVLIVIGLAGAHARQFRHSRWWGIPGVVAIVGGAVLFWLSPLLDSWALAGAGYVLLIAGSVLSGILMLAGRALPRWATPLLVLGALVLLGFNTEDGRAYLALPFGAAAIVLGFALAFDKKATPFP